MQKMITNPILAALKKTPYASTDGTPRDEKKVIARYFLPVGRAVCYGPVIG